MTNSKQETKISRRDWFRLRTQDPTSLDSRKKKIGIQATGLSDVPHPPNHDGLDLSSLPPMREATLSGQDVEHLISDIGQFGTNVQLMQRLAGARRAETAIADQHKLEKARDALIANLISRLQIRYQWQGRLWIDTIQRQPEGYYLVRIVHQST